MRKEVEGEVQRRSCVCTCSCSTGKDKVEGREEGRHSEGKEGKQEEGYPLLRTEWRG